MLFYFVNREGVVLSPEERKAEMEQKLCFSEKTKTSEKSEEKATEKQ